MNYNHLRYFWEVARDGQLTRTAERLNLSQSALSTQIRTLEDRLGHRLFDRAGRRLELTEVGRIALDHADRIFGTGAELLATLNRAATARAPLRVGALSTLSRNFQLRMLQPVLGRQDIDLVLRSGSERVLLTDLAALALDVVLTTEPPRSPGLIARKLAELPVGLFAVPSRLIYPDLKTLLASEPLILPTESALRSAVDALLVGLGVTPRIAADVDDMAMVRLLTREGVGVAIAPEVVLADEIASGHIAPAPFSVPISESFYAVTVPRSFPHPALDSLLAGPVSPPEVPSASP